MEEYIHRFGYLGILIGSFLEGETTVLLGGIFSKFGYLEIKKVILWAFIGTFSGDSSFFVAGRILGKNFLQRNQLLSKKFFIAKKVIERHGNLIIFFLRFLTGFRTVILLFLGCSNMGLRQFFFVTAVNALIWSLIISIIGYAFAHIIFIFFHDIKTYESMILAILISFIVAIVLIVRSIARKKEVKNGNRWKSVKES